MRNNYDKTKMEKSQISYKTNGKAEKSAEGKIITKWKKRNDKRRQNEREKNIQFCEKLEKSSKGIAKSSGEKLKINYLFDMISLQSTIILIQ